jgi:hypothetical protein
LNERVRVIHPRTEAARRVATRPASREIDEQTGLGELYMRTLIRSQRRLALLVCATVTVLLGGCALLGAYVPRLDTVRIAGVALPWVVLGVLIYPVMIGIGMYTVRQAERNESAFIEIVRRRP